MSEIASPPAVSIVATSTHTDPDHGPERTTAATKAVDSLWVRPTRSASSRTDTAPANGTTPSPSAVTDNPRDHEVPFTWKVLPTLAERDSRQDSFSQARSTFLLTNADSNTLTVNGLG